MQTYRVQVAGAAARGPFLDLALARSSAAAECRSRKTPGVIVDAKTGDVVERFTYFGGPLESVRFDSEQRSEA